MTGTGPDNGNMDHRTLVWLAILIGVLAGALTIGCFLLLFRLVGGSG
jgi:hypothetical protein